MTSKLLHKILRYALSAIVMAATGMLPSCSNDIPDPLSPEQDPALNVSFRFSAGSNMLTRADLPEVYGTALENRIDTGDLKILLFDENDTLYEKLFVDGETPNDNIRLTEITPGDYILTARLDRERYDKFMTDGLDFSVIVLANWRSLLEQGEGEVGEDGNNDPVLTVGVTKIDDLKSETFRLNQDSPEKSWVPTEVSLIPMFGRLNTSLRGYSFSIFGQANPMELGTVNLLRAVVKIEVIDNLDDRFDREISSVTLNRRNTRGYLLPGNAGGNTQQVTSARIPATPGVTNPAGFSSEILSFSKEGDKFVAYVPEFALAAELSGRESIDVTFSYKHSDGVEYPETRTLTIAPYNADGEPYIPVGGLTPEWQSLLRNHIYRFTISGLYEFELEVDVVPFTVVQLEPEFGMNHESLSGYTICTGEPDADGNKLFWMDRYGNKWLLGKSDDDIYATIDGKEYLFVFPYEADEDGNRRKFVNLHHIIDSKGNVQMVDRESIANCASYIDPEHPDWGVDGYIEKDSGHAIWIDPTTGFSESVPGYWGYDTNGEWNLINYFDSKNGLSYGSLYVWERTVWNWYRWDSKLEYRPKFWYDILGRRHEIPENEEGKDDKYFFETVLVNNEKEVLGTDLMNYIDAIR